MLLDIERYHKSIVSEGLELCPELTGTVTFTGDTPDIPDMDVTLEAHTAYRSHVNLDGGGTMPVWVVETEVTATGGGYHVWFTFKFFVKADGGLFWSKYGNTLLEHGDEWVRRDDDRHLNLFRLYGETRRAFAATLLSSPQGV